MNCALATRSTSALRAPTRQARSGRVAIAPKALSDVNVVIGGGKEEISNGLSTRLDSLVVCQNLPFALDA